MEPTYLASCVAKKGGAACGDRVNISVAGDGQGVIEDILPRTSLLYRSDAARQKLIAANVSQLVIVIAAIPTFSEELINRCIAAAEQQQLKVLLVCNKSDLVVPSRLALATLALYRELGYNVLQLSAKNRQLAAVIVPARPSQYSHWSIGHG